jgi:cystathionine beta-lyase
MRSINLKLSEKNQFELSEILLSHGKIAVAPGKLYGPSGAGFIRINFATSSEIIEDAVSRIGVALSAV